MKYEYPLFVWFVWFVVQPPGTLNLMIHEMPDPSDGPA